MKRFKRWALMAIAALTLPACTPEQAIRWVWAHHGADQATVDRAVAIAWCESAWNPHVTGRAGEMGLFQIHPVHRRWLAEKGLTDLYDPVVNATAAHTLWERSGRSFRPWTCNRHVR